MVPQRPFFIGNPGCVRSRACTCDFSSTHNTTALSGGFRYTPTTSVNFSTKRLSFESLNPSTRCGCNPCASQMRDTVALLTPIALAIVRVDQCVASFGVVCRVASTICLTFSAGRERELRPCGASSDNPGGPCSRNRSAHSKNVGREGFSFLALALCDTPSAASRQMRERRTTLCGVVLARTPGSRG